MPATDVWELNTQSFVIRLWIEEPATETRKATWRGHITHVPTTGVFPNERTDGPATSGPWALAPGERRYMQNLADITEFLAAFLRQMGVDI